MQPRRHALRGRSRCLSPRPIPGARECFRSAAPSTWPGATQGAAAAPSHEEAAATRATAPEAGAEDQDRPQRAYHLTLIADLEGCRGTINGTQDQIRGWNAASAITGIPTRSLRRMAANGTLASTLDGGTHVFRRSDLEALGAARVPRGTLETELRGQIKDLQTEIERLNLMISAIPEGLRPGERCPHCGKDGIVEILATCLGCRGTLAFRSERSAS